jgi:hypothetical protein
LSNASDARWPFCTTLSTETSEQIQVGFKQSIGANEPLRCGRRA